MQTELIQKEPVDAASALIAHLRANPHDFRRPPEELATILGVDPSFVEHVLDAIRDVPVERVDDAPTIRISLQPVIDEGRKILSLFNRLIDRPKRFLFVTTGICLAFCLLIQLVSRAHWLKGLPEIERFTFIAATVAIVATGAVHMAMFFRVAMSRYAMMGGLAVWSVLVPSLAFTAISGSSGLPPDEKIRTIALTAVGATMLSLVYVGAGTLSCVLGGWLKLKRREIQEERMTRQDLLERYFELQTRLRSGTDSGVHEPAWREWPVVGAFERRPYFYSFCLGFLASLTLVLSTGPLARNSANPNEVGLFHFLVLSVMGVLTLLLYIVIGYLASQARRAILASAMITLGGAIPVLIPLGNYGPDYYSDPTNVGRTLFNAFLMALLSTFGTLGARVQERAVREVNLQRNDQATLTAEMLRIQWRLSDGATDVCVMVVDVARSSEMKLAADPLTVEYSFREYQDWIEAICVAMGGRVHSTAGDGAVIAFESCNAAFSAARRIQTDISRFNSEINRLPSPFRLRVGLHVGHVEGDLDEVEFTGVIDIAAHIQSVAPTSGIALSGAVAENLADEDVVPLAKEVDGQKVFLALNPVED